ncbi:MAG TPA: 2,5-dihydroxypyridine 5,6-dioxygenase [Terriglobales bacterium]|nr:2,5-dihydroxypyridine 5,6-dioxygenase [Terriglobales bacterium]
MSTLNQLFRKELELCGVGAGQTVAVLSEGMNLRDYAEASLAAASALGAKVVDVNLPSDTRTDPNERLTSIGRNALSQNKWAMDACLAADLVVDHMLLLFSHEQVAMQNAGARVLLVVEPQPILERLFPDKGLRAKVEAAERRLKAAKTLRFTNEAGTDVTYQLKNDFILSEYGYTDTAGRWDHWPGGFLATIGAKGGVEGRVVMDRGDIIFPWKAAVSEPIEFIIRKGSVQEINGGAQAKQLSAFIDSYNDPRAKVTSHIGWGLNEACKWDPELPGIGMDGRAHYGNVLFSLGPDTEFGGDNDTACHLDLPMRNCSLWLDGEMIVEHGNVLAT